MFVLMSYVNVVQPNVKMSDDDLNISLLLIFCITNYLSSDQQNFEIANVDSLIYSCSF